MSANATFHIVGYLFGLAGFASMYWAARAFLVDQGRDVHLKVLLAVHFFRFFGLTALLPGVFDLAPAGFTHDYLVQIMAGDVIAALLALWAFAMVQRQSRRAIAAVWIFNVIGTLDYMNAGARVTPAIHDANILGPFGWIVMTVCLPAWIVSHLAIFFVLLRREPAMRQEPAPGGT